jgi:hypothetical protein
MIIYAHDPGKINYGFSVLRVIDDNIEVLKCGTFVGVQNAKNRAELALLYGTVVDNARVVNEYEVSVGIEDVNTFVIERYMSRNVGTSLLETVNLGTGYLLSKLPRQTEIEMITPAIWKNWCNKHFNMDELYAKIKVTPHEMDATLMALFILSKDKRFAFINKSPVATVTRIYKQMLLKTNTPLRKRNKYKPKPKKNKGKD